MDTKNKYSEDNFNATIGNTLLDEGFIHVAEQKPKERDEDGKRAWVWAAWSNNNQRLKVFADKVGTESCTADYWKPLGETFA